MVAAANLRATTSGLIGTDESCWGFPPRVGQEAAAKLDAFPFTRFGSVPGRVRSISRDAVRDKELGLVCVTTIIQDRNYVDADGKRMASGINCFGVIGAGSKSACLMLGQRR